MGPILVPIHLLVLASTVWNIARADHMAFTWIRGKVITLNKESVETYHKRILIGLIFMIITGIVLAWPMKEYLLTRPQFFVKMGFVVALIVNSFVIGVLQKIAISKAYSSLTPREKIPLFISGAVSTISWLGAAAGGFFLIPD